MREVGCIRIRLLIYVSFASPYHFLTLSVTTSSKSLQKKRPAYKASPYSANLPQNKLKTQQKRFLNGASLSLDSGTLTDILTELTVYLTR